MSNKKIKLVTLGDHSLVSSGVGTQSRYLFEGLLRTGRYTIRSLGGAMKHVNYSPQKLTEWGDDWIIFPIDGYGNQNILRQLMDAEKPDAIFCITDPRFYGWLFDMSDEIRDRGIPLHYWHVWDNFPTPKYNRNHYASCDHVACISKLTHTILKDLGFNDSSSYIPHAVDKDIFKPFDEKQILENKEKGLTENKDKFVVFYNSRNARRKMTSDVLKVFKMFLDKVGQDEAFLLMHTDPHDNEGANLLAVADMLGLKNTQIAFSKERVPPEQMSIFYNIADVTMNISNNEGFGLSCLESLSCGTPVIVNETGGLQDQVKDEEGNQFGVCVTPATRSLTGSQQIPYIFDDRCSDEDLVNALVKIYEMTTEQRRELGQKARDWTQRAFPMDKMINSWDEIITKYVKLYQDNNGNPNRIRLDRV